MIVLLLMVIVVGCVGCNIIANNILPEKSQSLPVAQNEKANTSSNPQAAEKKSVAVEGEVVGSSKINLPNEVGTYNAGVAAKIANGYVLKSGETFSYNKVIGERTLEKGFIDGNMPVPDENGNPVMQKVTGSGVCRLSVAFATAVKNAGFQQIEITKHTYTPAYFNSSNPGLVDATVYWPDTDNKFKNNKPYDVKIKSWLDSSYVLHVEFVRLNYVYQ